MVCSAVEIVFPPGVFITTIPRRVAAATSMLSTPTPARTIALSRDWPSRTSAVSCVPDRIAMPSASASAWRKRCGILGQLGVDHDLDPRFGAELGEPFFSQLVRHQHTMRRHPRPIHGLLTWIDHSVLIDVPPCLSRLQSRPSGRSGLAARR